MQPVDLHFGAATDVGLVRKANEDSMLALPPVFVVADGMGGHSGGDVASRIAVEEFARLAEDYDPDTGAQGVADAFVRAQARIVSYAEAQRTAQPGWHAGTTVVAAAVVSEAGTPTWLLANLGDSRIYRIAGDRFEQVSVDHSVVQELIDAGEITAQEASVHPERHVITRALGSAEGVDPDFFLLPLESVERLLLCSDGINAMITDAEIHEILDRVHDPRDAADALVRAALAAGGRDNATAVVVDVVGLVHDHGDDSALMRDSIETEWGR